MPANVVLVRPGISWIPCPTSSAKYCWWRSVLTFDAVDLHKGPHIHSAPLSDLHTNLTFSHYFHSFPRNVSFCYEIFSVVFEVFALAHLWALFLSFEYFRFTTWYYAPSLVPLYLWNLFVFNVEIHKWSPSSRMWPPSLLQKVFYFKYLISFCSMWRFHLQLAFGIF